MSRTIRVLIVDDSAFARKTLRSVLTGHADIEVVGVARDGLEGLEKIAALTPDIVTLDLVMPHLDGLGLLRALPDDASCRVIVVSSAGSESELCMEALGMGALELVRKPTALAADQLYELSHELLAKVRALADSAPGRKSVLPSPRTPLHQAWKQTLRTRVVVIGASTGGPNAITRLVERFRADFPIPIVIALHIPAGYTDALAQRLDQRSQITVTEAHEGLLLRPGLVVLAQGGRTITLRSRAGEVSVHMPSTPPDSLYAPSVDLLFESALTALPGGVLAVVLTGMGSDGTRGARSVRAAGGKVLTEAASSCVIYGMPRSVVESGSSTRVASIDDMARAIEEELE